MHDDRRQGTRALDDHAAGVHAARVEFAHRDWECSSQDVDLVATLDLDVAACARAAAGSQQTGIGHGDVARIAALDGNVAAVVGVSPGVHSGVFQGDVVARGSGCAAVLAAHVHHGLLRSRAGELEVATALQGDGAAVKLRAAVRIGFAIAVGMERRRIHNQIGRCLQGNLARHARLGVGAQLGVLDGDVVALAADAGDIRAGDRGFPKIRHVQIARRIETDFRVLPTGGLHRRVARQVHGLAAKVELGHAIAIHRAGGDRLWRIRVVDDGRRAGVDGGIAANRHWRVGRRRFASATARNRFNARRDRAVINRGGVVIDQQHIGALANHHERRLGQRAGVEQLLLLVGRVVQLLLVVGQAAREEFAVHALEFHVHRLRGDALDEHLAGFQRGHHAALGIQDVDGAREADDFHRAAVGDDARRALDGSRARRGDDAATAGVLRHVEQQQALLQLKLPFFRVEGEDGVGTEPGDGAVLEFHLGLRLRAGADHVGTAHDILTFGFALGAAGRLVAHVVVDFRQRRAAQRLGVQRGEAARAEDHGDEQAESAPRAARVGFGIGPSHHKFLCKQRPLGKPSKPVRTSVR